uniref:Regulator of microtubule dynamics protein 1 n=1 Tax=Rousettus aegyptiacus TaxID=9407 RepID=A0A7J8C449_ROUAE|nr:regulator of microtubule dynamics 1 [Rousettus aegyptiacus]
MQSYCGVWHGCRVTWLSLAEPRKRRGSCWCTKPWSTRKERWRKTERASQRISGMPSALATLGITKASRLRSQTPMSSRSISRCYTFAEMPWYQRRVARMLFAAPPSSTYEEALSYFQRAEQVDPNFYSKNLLLLGKTYLKLHNRKLAAFWLGKARDYPARTEEDRQIQTEAAQLLTSFSNKN